jgi:hypothetical protein
MGKTDLLSEKEREEYFKKLDKDNQIMHFIVDPIRSKPMYRDEYEKSFVALKEKTQEQLVSMSKDFMVYKLIPNTVYFA